MKPSPKKCNQLIELVKAHPCIYDKSLPQNKDVLLRKCIWRKIAREMNVYSVSWEDWRKFWRLKRDWFVRKRRILLSCPSGAVAEAIRKSPLFSQLTFLNDEVHHKRMVEYMKSHCAEVEKEVLKTDLEEWKDGKEEPDSPGLPESESVWQAGFRHSSTPSFQKQTVSGGHSHDAVLKNSREEEEDSLFKSDCDQVLENNNEGSLLNEGGDFDKVAISTRSLQDEKKGKIFSLLVVKMSSFSSSTQDWLEDELMKLYMEAKRKERSLAKASGVASSTAKYNE